MSNPTMRISYRDSSLFILLHTHWPSERRAGCRIPLVDLFEWLITSLNRSPTMDIEGEERMPTTMGFRVLHIPAHNSVFSKIVPLTQASFLTMVLSQELSCSHFAQIVPALGRSSLGSV